MGQTKEQVKASTRDILNVQISFSLLLTNYVCFMRIYLCFLWSFMVIFSCVGKKETEYEINSIVTKGWWGYEE